VTAWASLRTCAWAWIDDVAHGFDDSRSYAPTEP
jgi:hypothetical protein